MPLVLFIMLVTLITLFQKQTRKFFFPFIILLSLISFLAFTFNLKVKNNFLNFYDQFSRIATIIINQDYNYKNSPQYLKEFGTFYETWRLNKFIGGGIKNFRYYCHLRENIDPNSKFVCNMHPHNYYLEILTESGLVGFAVITTFFLIVFYKTFFKIYLTKKSWLKNNEIIPFIFLFIVEIFPIKSTGSFFTTGNATFLFLIIGILIALMQKDNVISNKNEL